MREKGRLAWLKVGGLCLVFILMVYILLALEAERKDETGPVRRTTYSSDAGGYKALYLWLKDMGLPIKRWEKSFNDLPQETSVLFIAQPELTLGTGEMKALKTWVSNGGNLVLAIQPPNILLDPYGLTPSLSEQPELEDKKGNKGRLFFQPGPYTQGVRTLNTDNITGYHSDRPEIVFHARDKEAGIVAVLAEGKGHVIAVSDPEIFSNIALKEADHSRLALNLLLAHQKGGHILVDEYHHGYGRATSVFVHLGRSHAMGPLVQGLIILVVLWAALGRRFGLPHPVVEKQHRSSMQYVQAMAQLFRRTGARIHALDTILHWIGNEAKRTLVDKDQTLQNKLSTAKQHLQRENITDRELLEFSRDLYQTLDDARSGKRVGCRDQA